MANGIDYKQRKSSARERLTKEQLHMPLMRRKILTHQQVVELLQRRRNEQQIINQRKKEEA